MKGNIWKENWKTTIDGVEIFERYLHPGHEYIYNTILIGDCCQYQNVIKKYDLIFMSDVLEHIPKPKAIDFLEICLTKCKYFLLNIPMGPAWMTQGPLYGNDHESHVSEWDGRDFMDLEIEQSKQYMCNAKPINSYLFKGIL